MPLTFSQSHDLEIPHVPTSTTPTPHQSGMISSHTTTDTRSLPCGENQGAAWSEVVAHNQQATLPLNGGTPGLLSVSTDLLRDTKGYSHFVVTRPRPDFRTRARRLGQDWVRAAKWSRGRQCWGIQPQLYA